MKTTKLGILLTLPALAWVGAAWIGSQPWRPPPIILSSPTAQPAPPPMASETNQPVRPAAFSWSQIEAADYSAYVSNLRRIGCPPNTLLDIVVADLFCNVARDRDGSGAFWNLLLSNHPDRDQARQTASLVNALLGDSTLVLPEPPPGLGPSNSTSLTASQLAVARMESELGARAAAIWDRLGTNEPGEADILALRGIQAERKATLRELLPKSEIERYEAVASGALAGTMDAYAELNLSEAEALHLIKLHTQNPPANPEAIPANSNPADFDPQLQLRALLGETRHALYEQMQDPSYLRLHAFAQDEHLPDEQVQSLYSALKTSGHSDIPAATVAELERRFGPEVREKWSELMSRGADFMLPGR